MQITSILLGDRGLQAYGWLIISGGCVRAILTPAGGDHVIHCWACDERLRAPPGFGVLSFYSLEQAAAWLADRLGHQRSTIKRTGPVKLYEDGNLLRIDAASMSEPTIL
jgi:hypothetical protein